MEWQVTLAGSRIDVERLFRELPLEVEAIPDDATHVLVSLTNPEGEATGDDVGHAAKRAIDALVARLNGLGRLRWGRAFEGVAVASIQSTNVGGATTTYVFPAAINAHFSYEELIRFADAQGLPQPPAPRGLAHIRSLELSEVNRLAQEDPDVARALRLVDLAFAQPEHLDWTMAYCALEVVEEDAKSRGLDGPSLGWWSKTERENFRATANSPNALGVRARHGKRSGVAEPRMNEMEAAWYVRRVVARWLAYRLKLETTASST